MSSNGYLEKQKIREYAVSRYIRQQFLDYATIALGRLGWGQTRLRRFEQTISEVYLEYTQLASDCKKTKLAEGCYLGNRNDERMADYYETLDRELRQYVGDAFENYKWRYFDE